MQLSLLIDKAKARIGHLAGTDKYGHLRYHKQGAASLNELTVMVTIVDHDHLGEPRFRTQFYLSNRPVERTRAEQYLMS